MLRWILPLLLESPTTEELPMDFEHTMSELSMDIEHTMSDNDTHSSTPFQKGKKRRLSSERQIAKRHRIATVSYLG